MLKQIESSIGIRMTTTSSPQSRGGPLGLQLPPQLTVGGRPLGGGALEGGFREGNGLANSSHELNLVGIAEPAHRKRDGMGRGRARGGKGSL